MIVRGVRGFAAKLTDYRRGNGLKIHEIPYSEAQRIYEEQAKDKLPLTEAEFREVISAEYRVFGRKGLGGPQPMEVRLKIAAAKSTLSGDLADGEQKNHSLSSHKKKLEIDFRKQLASD